MQVFLLSYNIQKSAQYLSDKNLIKQVLETAQILCTAHSKETPYKKTHINHPICKWARRSLNNYFWLCEYGKECAKEYMYRYKRKHKSEDIIDWCIKNLPNLPDIGLTEFFQAVPDKYKDKDPVVAYRRYYKNEKLHFSKWKNGREKPYWIEEESR